MRFRGELIKKLVSSGVKVYALAPDFTEHERIELIKMGAEPVDSSIDRTGINPIKDLLSTLEMAWLLKKINPDCVMGYFIKPVVYGMIAAWFAGVKHRFALIEGMGFVFMDDPAANSLKRRILKNIVVGLYRISLRHASRVIFINPDDLNDMLELKCVTTHQSVLIPGAGVDLERFNYSMPNSRKTVFILVARMLREKGVCEFVEAASILKKKWKNADFVLVGGTDQNPGSIVAAEIRTWVNKGIVSWAGQVNNVHEYLHDSSVFVLPSYREGLPRSTQEAMAIGRPIITTNVPGCKETVVDGVNGFLIPPRSVDMLVNAMNFFMENNSAIIKMGLESRRIAEARFDVNKINALFIKVLQGA